MTQTITVLSNADNYNSSSGAAFVVPVPDFTPAPNSLLVFTMAFFGTAAAVDTTLNATLVAAGWVKIADTNVNHRAHVYQMMTGANPTLIDYLAANNDADPALGTAYTLVQITGDVTGTNVAGIVYNYNGVFGDTFAVPDLTGSSTAGNSTYGIVISAGGASIHGDFSDTDLAYVDHINDTNGVPDTSGGNNLTYDLVGSGSSNQHFFAPDKIVAPAATYTESADQRDTAIIFLEITGNTPPATLPVLSSPTATGISAAGVTIGASTDTTTGVAYVVVDTQANITGITDVQIIAGQNNQGASPILGGNTPSTVSPFSIPLVGTLALASNFAFAIVQFDGTSNSAIITGTFATAGATNYGFRLPMVESAGVVSPNETGLTLEAFSDRSIGTKLGASFTSATVDGGNCVVSNDQLGASLTLGSLYFVRLYRTNPATRADNRDRIFELFCIDLDTSDNSDTGVT